MHRPTDQAHAGPFHYRLFGLNVRSDLPLPELRPAEEAIKPDVTIILGDGEEEAETLLAIDHIARFYVAGGSRIRVVPEPQAPARNVRLYLLGSAMGMLLHQRELLPLHANAVEVDRRGLAFMGPSGSGKSTLAAAFHDAGIPVIADDVCVVRFDGVGTPRLSSGLPRLRLWKDALDATGRTAEQFQRSYAGDDKYDKYDVPIGSQDESIELSAIYLLQEAPEFAITQLAGVEAVEAVFANTYRGSFVPKSGNMRIYWEDCVRLLGLVPVYMLELPRDHARLPQLLNLILAHTRSEPKRLSDA